MSRPEKPIDWKLVDQLLMAGCDGVEIAANFDMHPNTFYDRVQAQYKVGFTEYCSEKRSKGESLLRAKQFEKALEKDNTMLIWLGKQRLKQREPKDQELTLEGLAEKVGCLSQFLGELRQAQILESTKSAENHISLSRTDAPECAQNP